MNEVKTTDGMDYNELLLQAVAVLPWSSILTLMTNAKTRNDDRVILFYATETVRKGWG